MLPTVFHIEPLFLIDIHPLEMSIFSLNPSWKPSLVVSMLPFSGPLGQHQPVLGRLKVNLDEQVGLLYIQEKLYF